MVAHDITHYLKLISIIMFHQQRFVIQPHASCSTDEQEFPLIIPKASLKSLASGVLKKTIQKTFPHDPEEDARVAMELYQCVEEEWEEREEQTS